MKKTAKQKRQARREMHKQQRKDRNGQLRNLSKRQNPLQIQDKLMIPIVVGFLLVLVGLVVSWLVNS